jgi:hypothetical protein
MQSTSLISKSIFALGLSVASSCFGGTITFASNPAETLNNSSTPTIAIAPNPEWGAAFAGTYWVSNVNSGNPSAPGYVSPANGTSVTFTDTFSINGTPILGSLIVMADDTTSVTLNGVLLTAAAPSTNNYYTVCSDFTIGCSAQTTGAFNLLNNLHSGTNTVSFTVVQLAGNSFGLDYSGIVASSSSSSVSSVPEPGTLALVGLPLALFGIMRTRRKVKV